MAVNSDRFDFIIYWNRGKNLTKKQNRYSCQNTLTWGYLQVTNGLIQERDENWISRFNIIQYIVPINIARIHNHYKTLDVLTCLVGSSETRRHSPPSFALLMISGEISPPKSQRIDSMIRCPEDRLSLNSC